jgi:hypothetical protein
MKNHKLALFALLVIFTSACDSNSDTNNNASKIAGGVLTGEITGSRTLTADSTYVIKGMTYVNSGATLTIPAGTIIKGEKATKATLIVEQGGKIIADGTAQKPIIFTSDQLIGQRNYGDWGGIVLIGKAPHNRPSGTLLDGGIRGTLGNFGDASDNSGVFRYLRIEFAGAAFATTAGSKIDGLTLYGVGAGTVIDYVQVSYSGNDSYSWFGGTVNAKHLVALRGFDDDFYTNFGYIGKVQYAVSLRDIDVADISGSNGFESSSSVSTEIITVANANNAGLPLTQPVFSNISIFAFQTAPSNLLSSKGSGAYQSGIYVRNNTAISILNTVIVGYPEGLRLEDSNTLANAIAGKMDFRGVVFANMTQKYREGGGTTVSDIQDFFETVSKGNEHLQLSMLGLNGANFNLTAPNFLPTSASPLLGGAKFNLKTDGLETVAYRGAFGTTDWTVAWTNFNPQTTDYTK